MHSHTCHGRSLSDAKSDLESPTASVSTTKDKGGFENGKESASTSASMLRVTDLQP
jgi:hypothetical protein